MVKVDQRGFTLIEVTLTMAIASVLLGVVLLGQSAIRGQAEFSDAVQKTVTDINEVKNEAQSIIQIGQAGSPGTGGGVGQTVFAKEMIFTSCSNQIQVTDLLASTIGTALSTGYSYDIEIPWGALVAGSCAAPVTQVLLFHQATTTARLLVYTPAAGAAISLDSSSYSDSPPPNNSLISTATIGLVDPRGRTATITVDGTRDGAVTEVFQ